MTTNGHAKTWSHNSATENRSALDRVKKHLENVEREGRFFGEIKLRVKAGQISMIEMIDVKKPEEL